MFLYERKENFIRILGCLTCDGGGSSGDRAGALRILQWYGEG